MSWDDSGFRQNLQAAVSTYDYPRAAELCQQLVDHLQSSDDVYPAVEGKRLLGLLRRKRYLQLMQQVADALIQSGQTALRIRIQYAQSLTDQGNLTAAIRELEALAVDTVHDPSENAEARGLLGRAYKQLYVNAGGVETRRVREFLTRSVRSYYEVFVSDRKTHLWHGINGVALLLRGRRDGVPLEGFESPQTMALQILETVQTAAAKAEAEGGQVGHWDLATAAEACVALGRTDEARAWIGKYVASSGADAFELASTHRQLVEVWQLDVENEPGATILPILRAQLLRQDGGSVDMSAHDLAKGTLAAKDDVTLQKILGTDGFVTLRWYETGQERCRIVARVETETGDGVGTGFLLRGGELHSSLGDELVLLTNAHVISDDPNEINALPPALHPSEAVVRFEGLKPATTEKPKYRVTKILFSSPRRYHDATVVRLDPPIDAWDKYPIATTLPRLDGKQRVYVIGHPGGRSLSFSLHDNFLLDYDDRFLHYRAPTEEGSSGSPVFNDQWCLIALHHGGGKTMRRLKNKPGTYPANEGISIQAIIRSINEQGLRS